MLAAQLGESANELVTRWGKSGYRYGFPDYIAVEFPVRPMNFDRSRVYGGFVGRHYPDAETRRYYYTYDPNLYLQPGISGTEASDRTRKIGSILLGLVGIGAGIGAVLVAARTRG